MNAHVKTRLRRGLLGAVAVTALIVPNATAAGPGGGGGGGTTTGSLYSDLVLILRAENGTPVLKKYVVPATAEAEATTEYCVQPISYEAVPGVESSVNPVDGRTVSVLPLQGEWLDDPGPLPVAEIEPCDPMPQYAMFVKEAELERLNMARTADAVIAQKVADVALKLRFADAIALDGTGRIAYDDSVIDAPPENAGMYQSLMKTGTIPGLPTALAGPPALIGPTPAGTASNSQFDAWELAAMTIGAAASKSVPLSVDAVEYYNRVIGFPPPADPTAVPPVPTYDSPWGVKFVTSADPDSTDTVTMAGSERFVDYSGFTYNRSQTFKGSVTWLDVPTLTWKVTKITDVVPFTNLSGSTIGTNTLTGLTAFAQLADDVRAMSNFVPDNTFLPGFHMDVPGVDTTAAQLKAIRDPAVDLGTLPTNVFQTQPFEMTASLLNPWGGTLIDEAQLRITIDAEDPFTDGAVTATAADGQVLPFDVDGQGNLVGTWGPDTGFPVVPGYNVSTTFDVTVANGAPLGAYTVTLALVDVDDPATALAQETGTITVNANAATVMWGDTLPKYVTQGVSMTLPLQVYSPAAGTGELTLTVQGPGDNVATTDVVEAAAAGDVKVYASDGLAMVPMPLTLTDGKFVGTWNTTLAKGYTPVRWYVTVAEGALVGNYAFGVTLKGGTTLQPDPILVVVFAPETHGEQPPDAGEDTTAPVVTVTPEIPTGSSVTFTITANESPVDLTCMLTANGAAGTWAACTSPMVYSDLPPADYVFSVRATDKALNVSQTVTRSWTVEEPADETAPVVTARAVGTPGATASFTIISDDPNATVECMLTKSGTAGAWEACQSPQTYSDLAPGTYVLSVRGTDEAGNISAVYRTPSWTVDPPVDTTRPVVTITPLRISGATAKFALKASEPGVSFECRLMKNGVVIQRWAACGATKTYLGLKPASYVLNVRATDAAGNVSDVVRYTWKVKVTTR